jgi:hypothetical protein
MTIRMTIAINAGKVEITEGTRSAANVRAKAGRRLVWEAAASVSKFDLEFFRIAEGEGVADLKPDWPFVTGRAKPAGADADEFDGKVTGATKFVGRLAADPGIFKYSINATPSAGGGAILLDPQIIIDN